MKVRKNFQCFHCIVLRFCVYKLWPKGSNPFSKSDEQVDENVANLMGLSVGMTKGQVFDLVGVANYMEGYDWGSVWRYKIKKGGKFGSLATKR